MAAHSRLAALAWGLGGGAVAALLIVLPELVPGAGSGRLPEYAGLVAGLLAVHLAMRRAAGAELSFRARLANAAILALGVSALVGLSLYALFSWLRPDLLALRFASYQQSVAGSGAPPARIARELARLAATRPQYLDAAYQALAGASTVFFFGMLLGGYGAWRAELARRLRRR